MTTRILEVHRPVGIHADTWPACGACGDPVPCWDYLRAAKKETPDDRF